MPRKKKAAPIKCPVCGQTHNFTTSRFDRIGWRCPNGREFTTEEREQIEALMVRWWALDR